MMNERMRLFFKRLRRAPWVAVALVFLAISWGWDRLSAVAAAIVKQIPFESLKRKLQHFMEKLPPYPTLVVFLIPWAAHELMKLGALWLFDKKLWTLGAATYALADIVGLTLCAYIFDTNREKLLSISWFNRCYLWLIAAKDWALTQVAPIKARLDAALAEARRDGRPHGFISRLRILWRHIRHRKA